MCGVVIARSAIPNVLLLNLRWEKAALTWIFEKSAT